MAARTGIGLSAIGVFGIFLFLTYYLQLTLAYSPVKSGLAFLPMIAAIVAASTTSSGVLMPRVGPRPLIPVGLLLGPAAWPSWPRNWACAPATRARSCPPCSWSSGRAWCSAVR